VRLNKLYNSIVFWAVNSLTAPERFRLLLLLRKGLAQLLLLLLGQVGRDDLEVVLLELVDYPLRRRRPAGERKTKQRYPASLSHAPAL
jgi:hypothetical protein